METRAAAAETRVAAAEARAAAAESLARDLHAHADAAVAREVCVLYRMPPSSDEMWNDCSPMLCGSVMTQAAASARAEAAERAVQAQTERATAAEEEQVSPDMRLCCFS